MATEQVVLAATAKQSGAKKASAIARFLIKYFYFCMSLLIAAVVIYGFSHTVDHNLIHATPPRPWILWFHGAVFSGWLGFFIFQSALVRTGNVKLHRSDGLVRRGAGRLDSRAGHFDGDRHGPFQGLPLASPGGANLPVLVHLRHWT